MTLVARLKYGETLGDRVIKVDHAGEHGAVSIYRAQRWVARWRAPDMVAEIDDFISHELRHRRSLRQRWSSAGGRAAAAIICAERAGSCWARSPA